MNNNNQSGVVHFALVAVIAGLVLAVGLIIYPQLKVIDTENEAPSIETYYGQKTVGNSIVEKSEGFKVDPSCEPQEYKIIKDIEEEEWITFKSTPITLQFEYPARKGEYKFTYTKYPDCFTPGSDPSGEIVEWTYTDTNNPQSPVISIAGGVSPDFSAGREGIYTNIVGLKKEEDKFIFEGPIIFFNKPYLNPHKIFKTKYNTDAVLVNIYDFHMGIDQRHADLVGDIKDDNLLIVKLPENNSNFNAIVIYLPSWVDHASVERIVYSISVFE